MCSIDKITKDLDTMRSLYTEKESHVKEKRQTSLPKRLSGSLLMMASHQIFKECLGPLICGKQLLKFATYSVKNFPGDLEERTRLFGLQCMHCLLKMIHSLTRMLCCPYLIMLKLFLLSTNIG